MDGMVSMAPVTETIIRPLITISGDVANGATLVDLRITVDDRTNSLIVAGAQNAHVPAMLGWDRAESVTEAIAMAKSTVGPSPEITMMHHPPMVFADVE